MYLLCNDYSKLLNIIILVCTTVYTLFLLMGMEKFTVMKKVEQITLIDNVDISQ